MNIDLRLKNLLTMYGNRLRRIKGIFYMKGINIVLIGIINFLNGEPVNLFFLIIK